MRQGLAPEPAVPSTVAPLRFGGRAPLRSAPLAGAPSTLTSLAYRSRTAMTLRPGSCFRRVVLAAVLALACHRQPLAAALPLPPDSLHWVVYGDTRTNYKVHRRVVDRFAAMNPQLVIHTGDLWDEYPEGSAQWT